MNTISEKTIGRLSLYRRALREMQMTGTRQLFSHQLANIAGVTAAQVRRDLMTLGYTGSPVHGYQVDALLDCIEKFIDNPAGHPVGLVGIGNLGRAILAYFGGR